MHIGIENLEIQVQTIELEQIYCICSRTLNDAILIALNCFNNTDNHTDKFLITDNVSKSKLSEIIDDSQLVHQSNINYMTTKGKNNVLERLFSDIQISKIDNQDTLIIAVIPDEVILGLEEHKLQTTFSEYSNLAKLNIISILFITYGPHCDEVTLKLSKLTQVLCGLASIKPNPASSSDSKIFRLVSWKNNKSISSGIKNLVLKNEIYRNTELAFTDINNSDDSHSIYIVNNDLIANRNLYTNIYSFKSNTEIYNQALKSATAATIIFSLKNHNDVTEIAQYIYNLRMKRGANLLIFVKEIFSTMRETTEIFLLSCGANLIFEYRANTSYINAMLYNFIGQPFIRQITFTYEQLLKQYQDQFYTHEGYLPLNEFIDCSVNILSKRYIGVNNIQTALIILECHEEIPAEIAINEFFPKRAGDICTIVHKANKDGTHLDRLFDITENDCIALLLPSCTEDTIAIALKHIFGTEIEKLFYKYSLITNYSEILKTIKEWKNNPNNAQINQKLIDFATDRQKDLKKYIRGDNNQNINMQKEEHAIEPFDLNKLRQKGV